MTVIGGRMKKYILKSSIYITIILVIGLIGITILGKAKGDVFRYIR